MVDKIDDIPYRVKQVWEAYCNQLAAYMIDDFRSRVAFTKPNAVDPADVLTAALKRLNDELSLEVLTLEAGDYQEVSG